MSWRRWIRFDADEGGIAWAILCCWIGVLGNILLLGAGVPIFVVVPWSLFGVPLLVTLLLWLIARRGT